HSALFRPTHRGSASTANRNALSALSASGSQWYDSPTSAHAADVVITHSAELAAADVSSADAAAVDVSAEELGADVAGLVRF
ncbi:unnamed protein product, partial [Closterium sp. NIES-54]